MRILAVIAWAALAACASRPAAPPAALPPPAPPAPLVQPLPALPSPPARAVTLDEYKRRLAGRIASASSRVYQEAPPAVMKSIVVLYIRVDRIGRPVGVSVFRSNGYRELERRAVASVVDAVPLPAPPAGLLDDTQSLSFLETFLFRDDDRFQVRSLVGEPRKAGATSAAR